MTDDMTDMSTSKEVAAAKLPAARKLTFSKLVKVAVPARKNYKFPHPKDRGTEQVGHYSRALYERSN